MDVWELIKQLVYILPLLICIYQLGKIISEHNRMREDITKLQSENDATNNKIEDVKASNETALATIVTQLNGISVAIARLETTVNINKINQMNVSALSKDSL